MCAVTLSVFILSLYSNFLSCCACGFKEYCLLRCGSFFVTKKLTSFRKNLLPRGLRRFAKHAVNRYKQGVFRFVCIKTFCLWQTCTPVFSRVKKVATKKRLLTSSCPSVRPSIRMEQIGSPWTDFRKIWLLSGFFFENQSRTFKFHWDMTRITGTLHEDVCTFMTTSRSILLRMRNISENNL
jgi:hypothetical protein